MNFRFATTDLERLYTDPGYRHGLPEPVVKAFRKRMSSISAAPDERTFYNQKSLHFEKLKGRRSHEHSFRLNDQWRLVVELEGTGQQKSILIKSIEDYH